MRGMKQSCLRWTILYLIFAAAPAALIYARFPMVKVAAIGGLVSGFFLWMGIAYLIGIRARHGEIRQIRRAMQGGRPEDGEKIAVVGTVGAAFETFEAPMTKKRCVAYEYKVLPVENQAAGAYEGFALAPMTIEGPRGSIRLMAAPELAFPEEKIILMEQRENAREYVERTQFDQRIGGDIRKAMEHLRNIMADDDGRIRYDVQLFQAADLTQMRIWEKTVSSGEAVVALGRYSAARNALVPDPGAILHPVKLMKGDGPAAIRELKRKDKTDLFMSCGCLLPVLIAAFVALAILPLEAIEQMLPKKEPSWTEVKLERALNEKVRPKLAGTPLALQGEVTVELEGLGQARGKLTVGDTTYPLGASAATRKGDAIEVLLMSAADASERSPGVELRIGSDRTVESLRIVGVESVPPEDVELSALSITEEEIRGRVTYLGDRDGPHLRATFRASISPPPSSLAAKTAQDLKIRFP